MKINYDKNSKTSSKSGDKAEKRKLVSRLLKWYDTFKRDLPWRHTQDPYTIWCSEIILQQTRVNQGISYYHRFIKQFPTVDKLAAAGETEVLRVWQGLGYYSRARNLLRSAKMISRDYQGKFPSRYTDLIKLPGIGRYTAAAIASIAFSECRAVVDGNVYRVLSRIYAIGRDIGKLSVQQHFQTLAAQLIPCSRPGDFNQAIMELGALICTPKNPSCPNCPVQDFCRAYSSGTQKKFPVKNKSNLRRQRVFHYFIIHYGNRILMQKRTQNDIWKGLYEFYLVEKKGRSPFHTKPDPLIESIKPYALIQKDHSILDYNLSHQRIKAHFTHIQVPIGRSIRQILNNYSARFYSEEEILLLPKPMLIESYLKDRLF